MGRNARILGAAFQAVHKEVGPAALATFNPLWIKMFALNARHTPRCLGLDRGRFGRGRVNSGLFYRRAPWYRHPLGGREMFWIHRLIHRPARIQFPFVKPILARSCPARQPAHEDCEQASCNRTWRELLPKVLPLS